MRTGASRPPFVRAETSCSVHPAHAAAAARRRVAGFLLLLLHDDRFRREEERGDRRGVLQRRAGHLRRVDDARLDQILVDVRQGVVAELVVLARAHLLEDDRALATRVLHDHAERLLDRATDDLHADLLVAVRQLDLVERALRAHERHAAARDDALLDRRARGVQRVLDAGLLLLHLGLGRGADVDHGDTTGELGQPLLQLLLVVVRRGRVDRGADLLDAALDLRVLTGAVDERGVVLVDDDALGAAEVRDHRVLELEADFLADDLTVGQGGDVAQHRLAAIAEARRLDGGDAERAAELVHDQRGERLTVDVLGDDEQWLAELRDFLEDREQVLHRRDLLVVDEDVGILEDRLHLVGIGHEVLRHVAAVELHALDRLQRRLDAARLLDRDDAVLADLLHRLGNQVADLDVVVGRDGADLGDLLLAGRRHADALQLLDDRGDGLVDAALDRHRVRAGRDVLEAFAEDRLGEHGRRGGAVARVVGGLGRDLLHHLGAHVLERIRQLDLLGDGDTVLRDRRRAELLVDDDVPSLRTEGDLHRLGKLIDAALEGRARIGVEVQLFASHGIPLSLCVGSDQATTASTSLSRRIRYCSLSSVISVPLYLPYSTLSPTFTDMGTSLPSSYFPGPTAMISPCCGFSLAVSGMYNPPRICSVSSAALTTTRSASGESFTPAALLVAIGGAPPFSMKR